VPHAGMAKILVLTYRRGPDEVVLEAFEKAVPKRLRE